MIISMIAAMTADRAIGKDNQLLWHLPADLQFFKRTTLGKPVIMGRNTFESIGRPLPGRTNIVVSTRDEKPHPDVVLVNTLEAAIQAAGDVEEVMIIGGGKVYEAFLAKANKLYVTYVDADIEGDTYFPEFLNDKAWQEIERIEGQVDDKNPLAHRFVIYQK
ncbi:type 3 dihydrofolate reductase [Saccharobesus litoralis]|uniref:Dihydrofolate reductase n=1 Tax=Saccharobesus litoralis TaxID=2172099 RepID=A0A2S0VX57_9ALTE|nr:type 3 dihydrofolate reductase [Saccharobesus litoralis]AWB68700.1 type 3 dihydrofolate reductase [Saccharobesus litoralis]